MGDDIAIKINHVSKSFKLPHDKQNSIKGGLISLVKGGKRTYEKQEVLKDVSFEIKKGEFFGIVGRNGSGKSTLLKMLAGIYTPTSGSIQVNGSLTPFIELGVGFNPELTGRENVYLNGALLGFSRKQMDEMYEDIVEFAELERFMDQKLKNYSSGMQVRLAFSIAIMVDSDILVLDEVLAVGDSAFQEKCFDYFRSLKKSEKTVVFVSHDRNAMQKYCDKIAFINEGSLDKVGIPEEVLLTYDSMMARRQKNKSPTKDSNNLRTLNDGIKIDSCQVFSEKNDTEVFTPHDLITINTIVTAYQHIEGLVFGLVIKNAAGIPVLVTNTINERIKLPMIEKEESIEVSCSFENILGDGTYSISPALANEDATTFYDWREGISNFAVVGCTNKETIINVPLNFSIDNYEKGKE